MTKANNPDYPVNPKDKTKAMNKRRKVKSRDDLADKIIATQEIQTLSDDEIKNIRES